MVSDSINASIPSAPKDFGKKKRANRSAKLKQCKLDARREQWLSQVAFKNKRSKEELNGQRVSPCENEGKNAIDNLETRPRGRGDEEEKENGSIYHDFDSDSPSHSPTGSSVLSGTDVGTNCTGSSTSSSSSSSSGGCCSGSITEEEEEADDDCLDDWEAVADALAANDDNKQQSQKENPCLVSESSSQHEPSVRSDSNSNNLGSSDEDFKQECSRTAPRRLASGNSRAWRPDDAFRPQSLPNLSKQRSFPNAERHYGQGGLPWHCSNPVNVPSSCPICCEELDVTDTSFLPCICGFRLCLFCYNRILHVENGRCPGCRKNYEGNAEEAELSVNGGSLTFRLSRSYSMVARS
ncbi:hypothetical protein P3X46_023331 [Hevea brasiliensis]|uniref:RING-type domain-containing protein n=1 Tax=Hevea brasiliensis TaxID=3981 RepID=A0ABQ9LAP9_HEVBR|nr:uncharacterized protein LOC110658113 [Hevea brasiliensis]KAJ9163691.1 hypothetical protein P3X46_023331 [Hevea brasiliensis]